MIFQGFISGSAHRQTIAPICAIVVVLTSINISDARSSARDTAAESLTSEATLNAGGLEQGLREFGADIIVLSKVPPTQAIFRAAANDGVDPQSGDSLEEWQERLATIFTALASKGFYNQVRLLDATGRENVCIDFDGASISRTVGEALQDRRDRGYFTNAADLRPG